ncbi:MAG: peptidylprolyl isomerase [Candidatus Omnitrophota bacterium]
MDLRKNTATMTHIIVICVAMALTSLSIAGCGKGKDGNTILASIGGTVIRLTDFEERLSNLPLRYQEIVRKKKGEYLEELVNDTLLYQEALKEGLHKDKEVRGVIEEARKKILVARLLKERVDDAIVISDEETEKYYEENSGEYMTPEIMRVSHILLPTRKEAEEILLDLSSGEGFEEIAKAKSVDPTAQRGGDIGYFPKGQLIPEFENACAGLEINEISGIVKTTLGYHIIKLTDRRPPELRPIVNVTEDIRTKLRTKKRRVLFNGLLDSLRKKTEIIINERALSK